MKKIEDMICESIELLVNKALEKAQFDRTIIAQVVKAKDNGEYVLNYLGQKITAKPLHADDTYAKNDIVFVLIPQNNMESTKLILCKD